MRRKFSMRTFVYGTVLCALCMPALSNQTAIAAETQPVTSTAKTKEENAKWPGVDESVVEKFAREAGRPPSAPVINTDQGDLLLFMFLLAGLAGGFAMGYYFRALFPPRKTGAQDTNDV
jgi:hypothetical protein